MRKILALALAAVLFVACGDSATPDRDGDAAPLPPAVDPSGLWKLASGHSPSGEIEIPPKTTITMEFVSGDQIRGSAGCNTYGGGYSIEGEAFKAGGLALTEIGCPPDVAAAEEQFVEAVGAADAIARDRKRLTLTGPDAELVFRLVPPVDPKPLTGTVWILDGLVEGQLASSAVASAEPSRLLLEDDGTFEGTTGCRSFTGTWSVSGDVVTVTQMVFEGECKTAAEQDAHVASVIGTGFRAERKGDRLTLIAEKGDLGLVYRSR
ncbi:MAG: META domain-containing protein [Actinomycetota bacterium]|nr:META domain-containing protein [Actinomycetota bacterium]